MFPWTTVGWAHEVVRLTLIRYFGAWPTSLLLLRKHLLAAQRRQKAYADTKCRDVIFVEGDQVLLSTENLWAQGNRKLLPRFVGIFTITKIVGKHAYRLEMPPHIRIHSVMHVSLRKAYQAGTCSQPPPRAMMVDEDEEFEFESILLHRAAGKKSLQTLVRWKGYDASFDTWEAQSNLAHAGDTLAEYWRTQGAKPVCPR